MALEVRGMARQTVTLAPKLEAYLRDLQAELIRKSHADVPFTTVVNVAAAMGIAAAERLLEDQASTASLQASLADLLEGGPTLEGGFLDALWTGILRAMAPPA
jgi:hypothetical protein